MLQKKKLDVFSILENFCILYKKLFKKYQFLTNETLLLEITQIYRSEILKNLLEKLLMSFENFLKAKNDNTAIIIFKNYWIILKNLKSFYKDQHQGFLLKEIKIEIRDFKNDYIMREAKNMASKTMKTLINNNIKVFFKISKVLLLLTSKEKVDFDEKELKKTFIELIIKPIETEFDLYATHPINDTLGLLAIIKKEIYQKIFEFLFQVFCFSKKLYNIFNLDSF